ncbi:uncharacterized protein LOC127749882 [Frankliniella occidentalis]|uniref:Uncharacterized protein LOC127749882 n=1 Tax=Frankliniella occidentalis TaxID=133901 RepID=A0A9C6U1R4_FRAOC|nr:uncharacterized protein LOC127749882 [Frankliniella occidentalis]
MKCFLCHTEIQQKECNVHFKSCHGGVNVSKLTSITCPEDDCGRLFPTYNSYKKHANAEHSEPNLVEVSAVDLPSSSSLNQHCENVNQQDHDSSSVSVDATKLYDCSRKLENFDLSVISQVDQLVAKLYSLNHFPRSHVQTVIEDFSTLNRDLISPLESAVNETLTDCGASTSQFSHISNMFKIVTNSFEHLKTEYRRLQYFTESGCYIAPIQYELGEVDIACHSSDGSLLKKKMLYGQKIPLDKVLTKFLELPDSLSSVMDYVEYLKTQNDIRNYMQCPHWQSKRSKFSVDDIVLPLWVYYDDFECNNPLGSNCLKLGGTYVSLPCLPPECQSNIENIFVALIFKTKYRGLFGDKVLFSPLIEMLTQLEKEGILVSTSDGPKRVYVITSLLLGDNLGINSLGGFAESFGANYFCRFCKTHRCDTFTQLEEDSATLRDEISYKEDVDTDNVKVRGIKSECALNVLPSFHITSNYSIDSFHDLNEGVAHYTMLHVLRHCIPKYFDVDCLNDRISMYQYGVCESNKVPLLHSEFADRRKLKMSGSETFVFVKHFGLIIGDLVPSSDPFWRLYVKLRQVFDVCQSKILTRSKAIVLKVLVKEFNSLYLSVTNDTLKPKFHNLVHYPRALLECGAFEQMSTKPFERKHRDLLAPAHATTSRRNVGLTIAKQIQLNLCFRLLSNKSILPKTLFGPSDVISLYDLDCYLAIAKRLPSIILSNASTCLSHNWVEIKGTMYKTGMVLFINVNEAGPVFGMIEFIISRDECISFVFRYFVTFGFNQHVCAFEVDNSNVFSCISQSDLFDPMPLSLNFSIENEKYVILRHAM